MKLTHTKNNTLFLEIIIWNVALEDIFKTSNCINYTEHNKRSKND